MFHDPTEGIDLTPTGLLMEGVYTSVRRLFAQNRNCGS